MLIFEGKSDCERDELHRFLETISDDDVKVKRIKIDCHEYIYEMNFPKNKGHLPLMSVSLKRQKLNFVT